MTRLILVAAFLSLLALAIAAQDSHVEAVEVAKHNVDLLPGGKEADGIMGDFVLRNNKIHALISGNLPLRRANMATEYGFVTPGCLYDLDLRGANNDQITVFRPGGQGVRTPRCECCSVSAGWFAGLGPGASLCPPDDLWALILPVHEA
jgi:hypothetical protein